MRKGLGTVLVAAGLVLACTAQAQHAGGGDIVFTPREPGVKPVLFSHDKHGAGGRMKCTNCHYMIFQMARGSTAMTMEKIRKGYFCGECHNGQRAFDARDAKNCVRCHQ